MAVTARSESLLATRTPRGAVANDGYGSLMGMGAPRKKKKPVLVLDAEELDKAHAAIAMGGAQIMEEAGDTEIPEREAAPVSLLGLAPMGADDSADDDAVSYPPIPDASSWQDDDFGEDAGEDFGPLLPEDEGLTEEEFIEEGEAEDGDDAALLPVNLDHLLRPAAQPAEPVEPRGSIIPSIEEQLKKMRALPTAQPIEEAEQEPAEFAHPEIAEQDPAPAEAPRAGPLERLGDRPIGAKGFALSEPVGEVPPQPVEAAEPAEFVAPVQPELTDEEPLDLELVAEEVSVSEEGDYFDDAPDFSWMEPEQPRDLHIADGEHSHLRARLVHHDRAQDMDLSGPSLWQRIVSWFSRRRG